MDGAKSTVETQAVSTVKEAKAAPDVVFQPPKLKEVVEIINLMGTVASRVREDNSGDVPGGGTKSAAAKQSGTSARDEAIANAPPLPVMQKKLVEHLEKEARTIRAQARAIARSNQRGSAFMLNNLYRKMRRLSSLISQILQASAEMIKRFYIAAFIDQQPLVVTGGSLAPADE